MKIASFVSGTAALFSCALSLNAGAHALWLESGTPASKLYFGEYAENLRKPHREDSTVSLNRMQQSLTRREPQKRSAQAVKIHTFLCRRARRY